MCGFLYGKPHAVRWHQTSSAGNPGSVYTNCETALARHLANCALEVGLRKR
jgi:hypothetical protein